MRRRPTPSPKYNPLKVLAYSKSAGDLIEIEPARLEKVCGVRMQIAPTPTYHNDPTYNLKRK